MLPTAFVRAPWVPARTRKVLALDGFEPPKLTLSDAQRAQWLDRSAGFSDDPLAAMPEAERIAHIFERIENPGILVMTAVRHLDGENLKTAIRKANGPFLAHYGLLRRAMILFGFDALALIEEVASRAPQEVMFIQEAIFSVDLARARFEKNAHGTYAHLQPRAMMRAVMPIALGPASPLRERAITLIRKRHEIAPTFVQEMADEFGADARIELDALLAPPPLPAKRQSGRNSWCWRPCPCCG